MTKVLLVDDHKDGAVEAALRAGGASITVVTGSGDEPFKEVAANRDIDALVLAADASTPLIANLRARGCELPIVMCVPPTSESVGLTALENGLDDYVVRAPADLARLPAVVNAALARSRQRADGRAHLGERVAVEISDGILRRRDPKELATRVLQVICDSLKVEAAAILLPRPDEDSLRWFCGVGFKPDYTGPRHDASLNPVVSAWRRNESYSFGSTEARAAGLHEQSINGGLCLPLHSRQKVTGALCVGSARPREFGRQETELLQAAADRLGEALQHLREDRERHSLEEALEHRVREYSVRLALLETGFSAIDDAPSVDQAMGAALRSVCQHTTWRIGHALVAESGLTRLRPLARWYGLREQHFARLWTATLEAALGPDSYPGRCVRQGQAILTDDLGRDLVHRVRIAQELQLVSALVVPVRAGREIVGALEFFTEEAVDARVAMSDTVQQVASHVGRAIERLRLRETYVSAVSDEQKRVARELHDTVGGELTGLRFMSECLSEKLRARRLTEAKASAEITEGLTRALDGTRRISNGLLSSDFGSAGLAGALEALATRTTSACGIACTFSLVGPPPALDEQTGKQLYRVAQEATTNAVRHARARRIQLILMNDDAGVSLTVRDDGTGMEVGPRKFGAGIRIMKSRASFVGASLRIARGEGGGTEVALMLPARLAVQPRVKDGGNHDDGNHASGP